MTGDTCVELHRDLRPVIGGNIDEANEEGAKEYAKPSRVSPNYLSLPRLLFRLDVMSCGVT